MHNIYRKTLAVALTTLCAEQAFSAPIFWTDWTSSATNTSVSGNIATNNQSVAVNFNATTPYSFIQTGTGTNYWSGTAYTQGNADNAPTPSELIALSQGGTVTLSFSQTVVNPYIAINSWNSNQVEFNTAITIDSNGAGFWGSGTPILNGNATGFQGSGEVHGLIRLEGAFDTISFTHTSEHWHGLTVGIENVDVPVPGAAWLFSSAMIGLLGVSRKRK